MLFEKKLFNVPDAGGDYDTAQTELAPNAWMNAENVRTITTDAGEVGNLESIGSTDLIPNPYLPSNQTIEIGCAEDDSGQRLISFYWDPSGNHIICAYYALLKSWFILLQNSQVTGGLGFDKNQLIHSCKVENGCVYWTNYLQTEPRKVNIEAAIKMNHSSFVTTVSPYTNPVSQSVISWAKRQPGLPPVASKQIGVTYPANFVQYQSMLFCYRYIYREYEVSKLSGLSNLINFNVTGDNYNFTRVQLPFGEQIDQDVIQVDIVVKFLLTNKYSVIRSFLKSNLADAAAIAAHNAGTTQLQYDFFNDRAGITLDDAYAATPFDSIPVYAKSMEMAKNRSFMSSFTIGYNTPPSTSLALTQNPISSSSTITGSWYFVRVKSICGDGSSPPVYASIYVILIGGLSPSTLNGYYRTLSGLMPPGPTIDYTTLTYVGGGVTDVANSIGISGCINTIDQYTPQGVTQTVINAPSPSSIVGAPALKSDCPYQASVVFFDRVGRKCGIITNDTLKILSQDRTYGSTSFIGSLGWTLNNANALIEIPVWATDYAICLTKSLRTRFFLQSRSLKIVYAGRDSSNNYTFTGVTYVATDAGIAIDISLLNSYGMGYVFSQGDIVKIWLNGGTGDEVSLSIIDQSAQYIICQLQDVGNLTGVTCLYEIYTPYQQQSNEPYYEMGIIYPVVQPGTALRAYSVIADNINGDITLVSRSDGTTTYIAEAMSPNDKFYKNWFTAAGRPNFLDFIGQTAQPNTVCYSNTYLPGTQTNGLSTFDALDTQNVFPECGPITKLILTAKVAGDIGSIMLAICEEETCSLYLSETQMVSAAANEFLAQSVSVIGTVNVLKGSFGSTHPESVREFRGNVFFWSEYNGKIIQYASNGLFPISSYKMTRFWKLFSDQFLSMSQSDIEALGSRPFVFMCVDPHNWELLITIPKLLSNPPKGYLPDYPEMIYPFDIWDGQAKTIVYKLAANPNFWSGAYSHTPEGMASLQNKVFGFKNGQLYQHNSISDYSITIYGVQYKARIMSAMNQAKTRPKVYNNISIGANYRPSLSYFRTEPCFVEFEQYDLPEQASDLVDFDFTIKEGQQYCTLYRNKLQPTFDGLDLNGLLTGDRVRALVLLVLLEFVPATKPLELRHFTLGYQLSAGHTT